MPAIAGWSQEFVFTSPLGTMVWNYVDPTTGLYLVNKDGCDANPTGIRAEKFGIPQAAGSYLRRRFPNGYGLQMAMEFWIDRENSACAQPEDPDELTSGEMADELTRHLYACIEGGGRLRWTPTPQLSRIIDDLWLLTEPKLVEGDGFTGIGWLMDTRFPYAIDYTQSITAWAIGGATNVLTNTGTAPFFPVFKIYGPAHYVDITWEAADPANDLHLIYDSTLPGAHVIGPLDYVEVDMFRETAYLNGDGANRKAGIDVENTTFFTLEVGANTITTTGDGSNAVPAVDALWQPAWY